MHRLIVFMGLTACLAAQAQVTTRQDTVGALLNEWYRAGTAAGLSAITYENRDGQHSALDAAQYPQIKFFTPGPKTGPDKGPAAVLRPSATVGNCSMSAEPQQGGSLPRFYQMDPGGQKFLMMQYLANNLIIYPEHHDHDIGANGTGGYGDLYPANNACTIITQGSSGSDMPFIQAVLSAIAALPPETQRLLIEKRILMPTVQALFRLSNKMVKQPAEYFTGVAHPVVFDAAQLNEDRLVRLAHDMTPAKIPPLVQLEIKEETELVAGQHYFEAEKPHPYKLADTPVSIARILRGNVDEYGLVISAQKTADLMGRPLQVRWQVLQGDPSRVRVDTSGKGPYARIRVRWQPPVITPAGIRSHRVDIGVFATNGVSVSAPAFITFYMLPNEMHFYNEAGRVSEICYQAHNPDPGVPPTAQDTRWLRLMLDSSIAGDGLRSRLMEKLLTEEERRAMQKVWMALNEKMKNVQTLEAVPESKDAAAKLKNELGTEIATALETKLPGGRSLTVRSAIEKSLTSIVEYTGLYPAFQKELHALAAQSPKTTASIDLSNDIVRLMDLGVLIEQASGTVVTANPPDKLTPADRYYLGGLNLTLLSQVLFPQSLERSTAPAWVDPRMTTPKPWRDVFRYEEEGGARTGWIRHHAGRTAFFDPQGRHLPAGPKQPGKAVPVVYEKNARGLLEWRPGK